MGEFLSQCELVFDELKCFGRRGVPFPGGFLPEKLVQGRQPRDEFRELVNHAIEPLQLCHICGCLEALYCNNFVGITLYCLRCDGVPKKCDGYHREFVLLVKCDTWITQLCEKLTHSLIGLVCTAAMDQDVIHVADYTFPIREN